MDRIDTARHGPLTEREIEGRLWAAVALDHHFPDPITAGIDLGLDCIAMSDAEWAMIERAYDRVRIVAAAYARILGRDKP